MGMLNVPLRSGIIVQCSSLSTSRAEEGRREEEDNYIKMGEVERLKERVLKKKSLEVDARQSHGYLELRQTVHTDAQSRAAGV